MTAKLTPWRAARLVRAAAEALDAYVHDWHRMITRESLSGAPLNSIVIQDVYGYGFRRSREGRHLWDRHAEAFHPGGRWNAWWLARSWQRAVAQRVTIDWYAALWIADQRQGE